MFGCIQPGDKSLPPLDLKLEAKDKEKEKS